MYFDSQLFISPFKIKVMDAVNQKNEEIVIKLVEESDDTDFDTLCGIILSGSSIYAKMPIAGMTILNRLTSRSPLSECILGGIFMTKEHLGEENWASSVIEKLSDSDLGKFLEYLSFINQDLSLAAIVIQLPHGHAALTQSLLDMCYDKDNWAMGAIYQIEEKGIRTSPDQTNLSWFSRVTQEHDFTNTSLLAKLFGYFYGLYGKDCLTIARSAPVLKHEHHYNSYLAYGICSGKNDNIPSDLAQSISISGNTINISHGVSEDLIKNISFFASKVHFDVVSDEYPQHSRREPLVQTFEEPPEFVLESIAESFVESNTKD